MIKSACRILVENMTGLPNIQIQIDELYGMVEQQNKMLTDINVKSSKFVYSLLEPLRLFWVDDRPDGVCTLWVIIFLLCYPRSFT